MVANYKSMKMDYIDVHGNIIPGVSDLIRVKSIIRFIDQPELSTRVVLEVTSFGVTREFNIDFGSSVKSQETMLEELTKREYFISFKFVNALRDYLINSAQYAQSIQSYQFYHETLGYLKENSQPAKFLLGDTAYMSQVSLYADRNFKFISGINADYDSFMSTHILPYQNMRFALVLGLCSVAASYLKDYADVGTMLINLSGASSTGKTTTAQFIASLWGEPKISNLGLVRTFNSTLNALLHSLRGVSGVPVCLDDATTSGFKNRTELIYQLAQSEPKLRMTSSIELRDSGLTWSGALFITSETPIIYDSETRMGIVSRVIDTDGLVFTDSAEHAEEIKRFISGNFGHIGRAYAMAFNKMSDTDIKEMYDTSKQEVMSKLLKKDSLTSRIASKIAIVYMTAKLSQNLLGLKDVIPDEILDYLVKKDQLEIDQRHVGEKALEVIKNFLIENHRHFEKLDKHSVLYIPSQGAHIGHVRYLADKIQITIPTAKVEEILRKSFIYDTRVIYTYWHSKGFIHKQNDRYSISDSRLHVRTIKFSFSFDEESLFPIYNLPEKVEKQIEAQTPVYKDEYECDIDQIFTEDSDDETGTK
jgi:hypothetical protein